MIAKLQKKTLVKSRLAGYALSLLTGTSILLIITQLYLDVRPLLIQESSLFKKTTAVVSKQISVFKSMDKEKIYFTQKEIDELKQQPFVKNISKFRSAGFKIQAYSDKSENIPAFYTDLFFESIPNNCIDVQSESWNKIPDSSDFVIPVIIPENYLNLYNFGFAESQGLPVLSKNTIEQLTFQLRLSGNNQAEVYKSKIVGFSNKINSILVPENFLRHANKVFGTENPEKVSRILVEFKDPSDESILKYFNAKNYSINQEKLALSKIIFFLKSGLFFILFVALIILGLSIAFILLSFSLILEKNKTQIINLHSIGYGADKIARFYRWVISLTTLIPIIISVIISYILRNFYLNKLEAIFEFAPQKNRLLLFGIALIILLLPLYNVLLLRKIRRITNPKR